MLLKIQWILLPFGQVWPFLIKDRSFVCFLTQTQSASSKVTWFCLTMVRDDNLGFCDLFDQSWIG